MYTEAVVKVVGKAQVMKSNCIIFACKKKKKKKKKRTKKTAGLLA